MTVEVTAAAVEEAEHRCESQTGGERTWGVDLAAMIKRLEIAVERHFDALLVEPLRGVEGAVRVFEGGEGSRVVGFHEGRGFDSQRHACFSGETSKWYLPVGEGYLVASIFCGWRFHSAIEQSVYTVRGV